MAGLDPAICWFRDGDCLVSARDARLKAGHDAFWLRKGNANATASSLRPEPDSRGSSPARTVIWVSVRAGWCKSALVYRQAGANAGQYSGMEQELFDELEGRLGHARMTRRLAAEQKNETRMSARRSRLFGNKRWYSAPWIIQTALRCAGLYGRARKNAESIEVRQNVVRSNRLPLGFDGFTILQISDLHADMNPGAMSRLATLIPMLDFNLCVLTGDYRGKTYGPFDATLDTLARLRACLPGPIFGVLGNHDTIHMVPGLERLGIRMLLNESAAIAHRGEEIHLAGVDDAHYYRTDDLEKAASAIPDRAFSILLSHTPENYRQAAKAGFDLLLGGHTHGGQLCLPGSVPVILDADLPRRMGSGAWKYQEMAGYTSVGVGTSIVAARLNCPPEISLHKLVRAAAAG